MKNWTIGALAGACVGVSIYLLTTTKAVPVPGAAPDPPPVTATAPTQPAPLVLARVVEVTDIDPLLDPPEKPVTGVPFDADPATTPVAIPAVPERIPPAVD